MGSYPQAQPPPGPPTDPHAAYLQYTDISKIMGLHLPEDRRPHESTYASLKPYYQTDEDGVTKYHKIMAAAGYYVHPSKLNPRANPVANPSSAARVQQTGETPPPEAPSAGQQLSSSSVQQIAVGADSAAAASTSSSQPVAEQGPGPSSASRPASRLNPHASPFPRIPAYADHLAYSSSFQPRLAAARLNPNATPYYPPIGGTDPTPAPCPPGSPYQQQQASIQGTQNPMQPLHGSFQGLPNPVSERICQQPGVASLSADPSAGAGPAQGFGHYPQQNGNFAQFSGQLAPNPEYSQQKLDSQLGYDNHQGSRVGGHRQHLAEKLHLPMDWHMDVLAGKAPATFSPLGDQATSGYFPPILSPDSAMHTSEYTVNVTQPHRLSPNPSPKRYAQHALRVSAEALGQTPYSQGGQTPAPPQQWRPSPQMHHVTGVSGLPYPSYSGAVAGNPSQAPTVGGHRPQSPSVIVHPGENPEMASYLSQQPADPTQGFAPASQGPSRPSQRPGYPSQGVGYPNQMPAYPSQRPGYPYQGPGFTITPLPPPGQATNLSHGAGVSAHTYQAPPGAAPYPHPNPPGYAGPAPQVQQMGPYPYQSGIMAAYPTQMHAIAAYPSQSSHFISEHVQVLAGGSVHSSQSGPLTPLHKQSGGYTAAAYQAAAYPNMGPDPSYGGLVPAQQGQGMGAAGGPTLGAFVGDPLIGSNGKPRISGKPMSWCTTECAKIQWHICWCSSHCQVECSLHCAPPTVTPFRHSFHKSKRKALSQQDQITGCHLSCNNSLHACHK